MTSASAAARFWDRRARSYAGSQVNDLAGWERTLERTRSYLRGSDTVIEFGCGSGGSARKLAATVAHITATDISKNMIAIARERAAAEACANASFEVATADAQGWDDGSFDAALAFNVIHLLADRWAALQNIRRILKPGGYFISKTPCLSEMHPIARFILQVAAGLLRIIGAPILYYFSAAELEREVEAAGFRIVERDFHASKGRDIRPFLVALRP